MYYSKTQTKTNKQNVQYEEFRVHESTYKMLFIWFQVCWNLLKRKVKGRVQTVKMEQSAVTHRPGYLVEMRNVKMLLSLLARLG